MTNKELINSFSDEDSKKVASHLEKLLPYLDTERFAVVGGLAIRYHLAQKEIPYVLRPFNDLDIMMELMDAIDPKVTKDFMVYHYHPSQKNDSFYLVLVYAESRTKVDIFDYKDSYPEKLIKVPFEGNSVQVVSVEDQLVKTVIDIQRISEAAKVDPKQFNDTSLLMQIADMKLTDSIWKRKNFSKWPKDIGDAITRARKIKDEYPEWVKEKPFRKLEPYVCRDCVSDSSLFPLTPMETIYKVLGYVE